MTGWRLNQWQRLIVIFGALACFARSYYLELGEGDSGHPGTAFLVGIALSVLALSPAKEGGAWLPFQSYFQKHWRRLLTAAVVVVVLVTGLTAIGVVRDQQRQAREQAEAKVANERLAVQNAAIEAARLKKIQECIKQSPSNKADWAEYTKRRCAYINAAEIADPGPYGDIWQNERTRQRQHDYVTEGNWIRENAERLRQQDVARIASQKARTRPSSDNPYGESPDTTFPEDKVAPDPSATDGHD